MYANMSHLDHPVCIHIVQNQGRKRPFTLSLFLPVHLITDVMDHMPNCTGLIRGPQIRPNELRSIKYFCVLTLHPTHLYTILQIKVETLKRC